MVAALRNTVAGGVRDIFAKMYPRWGTGDLLVALNGVYNQGVAAPHDSSATTWVDLIGNTTFTKLSGSMANPLWDSNCMRCDSTRRCIKANLDLSSIPAYTLEVFGYFASSWGQLFTSYKGQSGSTPVNDVMPYGSRIGATINLHNPGSASFIDYTYPSSPSTTDLCLTCDSSGNLTVYADGEVVASSSGGAAALTVQRSVGRLTINGDISAGNNQVNGSKLFGVTIYGAALTQDEVRHLNQANRAFYVA